MRTTGRLCVFLMLAMPLSIVVGCGGSSGGGSTPPPPTTYTIGGTVSGLTGTGLVLQDNGGNNLAVSASGSFTFSTAIASGAAYSVTVLTQPTGQSCTVTSGSGTASANVTNVQVACSNLPPTTYTIGGTVSGLTGTGLVLQDNGGNNLAVSASGSFTFSTAVASGAAYSVTVLTQPTGQSCTVTSGSGTTTANVTNVQVTCTTITYTIGGTISGLTASGLVLADGSQTVSPASGATSFAFPTAVASGSSYAVTVKTQPSGETCTVTNGSGTVGSSNVTGVAVSCTANTYTFGGTVSGLTGTGLVLFNGSTGDKLPVSANGSFTFGVTLPSGASYSVTVFTQPTGQSCTVANGSGTISANVTNIQVACTATTYTIGGTVSGLTGTGLVLQDNGSNNLAVSASGSFAFSTAVASGAAYSVTVFTQPTGQSCTVTNGSGTASANVSNVQVTCSTTTYTIGGTVSGLTGTGLVLQDNSGNNLAVSASGSFTFSNSIASGAAYSVTVLTQPTGQTCTVTNGSGTATANVANVQVACSTVYYTVGGTVSGLTGTGLVLQDNGGNNLSVSANGVFSFSNSVASAGTYSVTVLTQPTGQTCTVSNGSGKASANVSNVQVTCSTTNYTVGGTVSGLTGTGLVLQDNGGNNLAVSANGAFTFSTSVASGAAYSVTVLTQPTGQSCTVTNGSSTVSANVTNVLVACSTVYYNIGGTLSGLTGTGLVLQDNGGYNLSLSGNGSFSWNNSIASGATYSVTVLTQPTGQICTVSNSSGTATANVTNVLVACSNVYYTIGGTVSGLTGTGMVLQDNGGNNLTVNANGAFTFSNSVARSATYSVTLLTQPAGQSCTVSNGSGTATANVTNVQVACSNVYFTIGGTASGLTGTGLVLQDNAGNNLSVSANGLFTFSNSVASGATYSVTVLTQPTGQSCAVSNGSGTATANVTNVQVACSNVYYTIGGTVSGLTGTGLVLQDNGGNNQTVSTNGAFTFSNSVASGAAYSVTVLTQPTGQSCTVTSGSGTATANVTNVQVSCSTVYYTIGGTVSGLTGTGLVLQDNRGNNLPVGANGSFTFSNSVARGAAYNVTVLTQPTGQSCTVTNGSGTASANVTNVQLACSNVYYTIGGTVSGLIGTGLVLGDNGGNNLSVSANGSFTFSNPIGSGLGYNVTVLTQPIGQFCGVSNGSNWAYGNVTNVQVTCTNVYTIGGAVSGLTGTGLVLQDNGGNNLPLSANGPFTFSTPIYSGSPYSVTVFAQPNGQFCTVTNGSGTATANVANIQVACLNLYSISGTVSGLTGTGMVLQDNGGNNLTVSANGAFTFSNSVASGSAYSVTVLAQPTGQFCTVTNGSGTASANVTNVQVACSIGYSIGGTVNGLKCNGPGSCMSIVLQNNGGNNLTVSANGPFTFTNPVASGAAYNVTILTPPNGQICTVAYNGSGTATANVTNVQVSCSLAYTIGGTVSGLTGAGLVLQDNGGNNLSITANGTFTFSNLLTRGSLYSVTVLAQPTGQNCSVDFGSGTANGNVTIVQIYCTNLYTIGGAVSGLTGTGLVLQDNGGNNLSVSSNGAFTFSNSVYSSSPYSVTVFAQPTSQFCTVTNGSGTASANVTNVQITCSIGYSIGGTVSGLTGTGLVLQDNGGNNLSVSANGSFTILNSVASGTAYSVTVLSQPTNQFCTLTNGSGTATANVTNVQVTCSIGYSIGGSVYGLTGSGLVLQNSGGNNLSVSANGSFTFSNSIASGAAYSVSVLTQPTVQNCTVISGSGTATANVTSVLLACVGEWAWMSGSSMVPIGGIGQSGVYGMKGSPASTNAPGGRTSAVTWRDSSGNLWMFGGRGLNPGTSGSAEYLSDLWEFYPAIGATGEWAWMGGSSTLGNQFGVYGTLGTAASTNIPGGRQYSASWSDASGNLWMFGGYGYSADSSGTVGYLNDLWKYVPGSGRWTWMSGSAGKNQSGVYGGMFNAAPTNAPGSRYGAVSWIDASGKLWLFGGYGIDSQGSYGELNDLWKFDPALGSYGEWTWMGGSNILGSLGSLGQSGVYGTLGAAASTNIPGGRDGAVSWIDGSGNLWLFGGHGLDSQGGWGNLNDLWKFDPSSGAVGEWTWMGGSNIVSSNYSGGQSGVYGTLGIPATTNIPGGREYAVSWIDASGNLWLFGGYGNDSTGTAGYVNDLWAFDPSLGTNGEWTWMGGSSTVPAQNHGQPGVYGTLGTLASTNIPGGREYAVSWTDASGNLWLFGGDGFDSTGTAGFLNDLWEYQP